ncbi:MAG: hypothetical protein U0359_20670 [Byssovorax sp.]
MTQGTKHAHVYVGADQASDAAAIHRSAVVGTMAVTTPRYFKDATFKAVIDDEVQAGLDLGAAATDFVTAKGALANARGILDAKRRAWRKANSAAVTQVEKNDPSEQEILSYGYAVLDPNNPGLVVPSEILLKYDAAKGLLRIRVKWASGTQRCLIEISPDPAGPGTWAQLSGTGSTRALSGYAPGTYWVRAATVRAKAQSDWFGPVAVVVK